MATKSSFFSFVWKPKGQAKKNKFNGHQIVPRNLAWNLVKTTLK
jgi:hypothetical protein